MNAIKLSFPRNKPLPPHLTADMLREQHEAIVQLRNALEGITNAASKNLAAITTGLTDKAVKALKDTEHLG